MKELEKTVTNDLWEVVMEKARGQQAKGLKKYGTPVTPDAAVDWLSHAIEEHLDAAVYLEAAKSVVDLLRQEVFLLTEKNTALLAECAEWEQLVSTADRTVADAVDEKALLKRKIAELEEDYKGQCQVAEQRWELLQAEKKTVGDLRWETTKAECRWLKEKEDLQRKVKAAEKAKERAEEDTQRTLKRLREYHRSEGTLAMVAAVASLSAGLLIGYLLF